MSTTKQDKEFGEIMQENIDTTVTFGGSALDAAIEYIGSNFNPVDVFTEKDLQDWAEANGYVKE